MTYMLELFYRAPADKEREKRMLAEVASRGGRLDFRETSGSAGGSICLTFEFESVKQAELAAEALRAAGEHVENIGSYG